MKKVYLITFHGSVNYGAVLQAYALFRKIQELGFDAEVIDYNREKHHQNFLKVNFSFHPKSVAMQLIKLKDKIRMHRKFHRFSTGRMKLTAESFNGCGSLNAFIGDADAIYLVGSDQVWNCRLTGDDYHYYLDFTASKNKYSYGSSFGVSDISDWDEKDRMRELLRQFRKISVREEAGAAIVEQLIQARAAVVCDPTFLLSASDWESIARRPKQQGYVLLFMLSYDERLVEAAKKYAREKSLALIHIVYTGRDVQGSENVRCLGPEEWLGYFANAGYVFTNSFHGFAFSLNFRKQVWVSLSAGGRNSRILNLAERYGVSDHILDGSSTRGEPIDYLIANEKMKQDLSASLLYLESCLNQPDAARGQA